MLLMDQPTFTGCMVRSRLLGVIEAEQTEEDGTSERNDRIIAVSFESRQFEDVQSVKHLAPHMMKEIETFFVNYNRQFNRKFKVIDLRGPHHAETLAEKGMKAYAKRHHRGRRAKRRRGK